MARGTQYLTGGSPRRSLLLDLIFVGVCLCCRASSAGEGIG